MKNGIYFALRIKSVKQIYNNLNKAYSPYSYISGKLWKKVNNIINILLTQFVATLNVLSTIYIKY